MDKHSPTPWRVENVNQTYHVDAADGSFVALFVSAPDAALIVEAVNGRKRDEALIASLLYHHLEDFAEAVASKSFTRVIKAAFRRLGLKYEPFGPDALETVEQRMKEGGYGAVRGAQQVREEEGRVTCRESS